MTELAETTVAVRGAKVTELSSTEREEAREMNYFMTPKRQIYLANIGTKERLIREMIKKEKAWLSNCKHSLTRMLSSPIQQDYSIAGIVGQLKIDMKKTKYLITALRKEICKDRIKGVPVIQLFAELGDNDLYCKHCGNLVWHEGQGYVVKYCDNCGKLLDWSGWV